MSGLVLACVAASVAELASASVPAVPVTVKIIGRGSVASSPPGLSCPTICSRAFRVGGRVRLTATPAHGWGFETWDGTCAKPSGRYCTITPKKAVSLHARFQRSVSAQPPAPPSSGSAGKATVWDAVITAKTSRQFTDVNTGAVLNTCFTNWRFSVFFVVYPSGKVAGHGFGATQTPLSCSPHQLPNSSLVTTGEEVSVAGTKDSKQFSLRFGVTKVTPDPSGDDGGVLLLFTTGACPSVARTVGIPIQPGATSWTYQTTDQGQLTGCAGSGKDVVQMSSDWEIEHDFDCADVPPNFDQEIIDLCKSAG